MNGIWVHYKSGDRESVSICDDIQMHDNREDDMMSILFYRNGQIEHELINSASELIDVWNAITYAIYQGKKYIYVSANKCHTSIYHEERKYGQC